MESSSQLTESKMMQVLEWGYEKAIQGLPGMESAEELAKRYLEKYDTVDEAIDTFINWQCAKCATSGFITGLGGLLTLPVAIPANISSVIFVQIRMIATIAKMRGYNLKDDQVKTLVFVALTGQAATDIFWSLPTPFFPSVSLPAIFPFLLIFSQPLHCVPESAEMFPQYKPGICLHLLHV